MTRSPKAPWWRDAVVYEVYVRSFADADGDGDGDLQGLRNRLPYLRGLGVDALWLTPFYRSPMADGGYDVADYRDVDPRFGTLADFDALVADAHAHGLRLIVDIVPNHTSDQHPWFLEALAAPPGAPARDRYLFRPGKTSPTKADTPPRTADTPSPTDNSPSRTDKDSPRTGDGSRRTGDGSRGASEGAGEPPNDWTSSFGGSAWRQVADGEWYLHLFAPEQPDLNWRHPEVRREFEDILRFWLDRGVDGFRIDVAMGLFKDAAFTDLGGRNRITAGGPLFGRPEVHALYREWRRVLDSYDGERMAIGEVWTDGPEDLALYLRPGELHQVFQFDLQLASWSAREFRKVIDASRAATEPIGAAPTWVLSSHDATRHASRYQEPGDPPGTGLARARAALLLVLALPGSAYLYQGEELGLPEVTDLPDAARQDPIWFRTGGERLGRDGCRIPLPWSGEREPYGFSPDGTRPWLPMPEGWGPMTAQAQARDEDSTLDFYRRALRLRRELLPTLPESMEWLDAPADTALTFRRGALVCLVNFGPDPVRVPEDGDVLAASAPVRGGLLPGNAGVWLTAPDGRLT